jgi:hypothetical protein
MYEQPKSPHNSERFKPTYILIALNIAAYLYTSIAGGNFVQTADSMFLNGDK